MYKISLHFEIKQKSSCIAHAVTPRYSNAHIAHAPSTSAGFIFERARAGRFSYFYSPPKSEPVAAAARDVNRPFCRREKSDPKKVKIECFIQIGVDDDEKELM